MANRRISVYIPQTNPFTCPIDTFFIVRQTKNRLAEIDFSFGAQNPAGFRKGTKKAVVPEYYKYF